MAGIADRPDMTAAVYRACKAANQTNKQNSDLGSYALVHLIVHVINPALRRLGSLTPALQEPSRIGPWICRLSRVLRWTWIPFVGFIALRLFYTEAISHTGYAAIGTLMQ